ncbi:MarR family winged helix-turn-helix transcriptional regulator [Falsirhodobacter sp. 20TX0035]|uniref:MarR family winged helix-turn-helix transcriptional regulator n=1 Tax=Falsirhodobacter sp. 20TX0035 TaxID=3022019 RepID=UPI00232CFED0|nr:MarR family winged helix-turn-helix transcriptional regulator [Falsirhodobacter sp. 20TX0035]MDB6454125.1 MarR family winged helix-turn-helix transcriptional regulator [Falsirhodobacter sp. 20TX0035]
MSTIALPAEDAPFIPPSFAALMRMASQDVRARMLRSIHEAGFAAFQEQHFAIFAYPLPNGIRPSDLAREKRITRQALNYLLAQLEEADYLIRWAPEGETRRLIYLTPKGHQIAETMFACLKGLEREWSHRVGEERFAVFVDVLREMASDHLSP